MRRALGQATLTLLCAVVAAGWLSLALRAPTPAFDVASVKENSSGGLDGVFRRQPGRFTVTNLSQWIIHTLNRGSAITSSSTRRVGRRGGTTSRPRSPRQMRQGEVRLMLQRLLADRFGLQAHREERRLRLYELTQSSPGVLLTKLTPAPQTDCGGAARAL